MNIAKSALDKNTKRFLRLGVLVGPVGGVDAAYRLLTLLYDDTSEEALREYLADDAEQVDDDGYEVSEVSCGVLLKKDQDGGLVQSGRQGLQSTAYPRQLQRTSAKN